MRKTTPSTKIQLITQDDEILAVDKPAGISVHNPEDPHNLLKVFANTRPELKLFPVHRLDKETSGVQLFALNSRTAQVLAEEFQKRAVLKIYRGIMRGRLAPETGEWTRPLSDRAESRRNPAGTASDRVPCTTHYRVLRASKYFSEVELDLETGRQHQIRKHAALAEHALVGDSRYGDPRYNARMAELYGTDRMFLHCARLEIAGRVLESSLPPEFHLLFPA